jgi:hypothetical protein
MEQELLVAIPEAVANLTKLEKCGIIRKNKKSYDVTVNLFIHNTKL